MYTGCMASIIGRRLLPKDTQLSPLEKELYAANQTRIPVPGGTTMDFTVQEERYSIVLAVTDQIDGLILGLDWLLQVKATLDLAEGSIYLGGKWIRLQTTENPADERYVLYCRPAPRVRAADAPLIPDMPPVQDLLGPLTEAEHSSLPDDLLISLDFVESLGSNGRAVLNHSDDLCKYHCPAAIGIFPCCDTWQPTARSETTASVIRNHTGHRSISDYFQVTDSYSVDEEMLSDDCRYVQTSCELVNDVAEESISETPIAGVVLNSVNNQE